jgi:hypothetical protein
MTTLDGVFDTTYVTAGGSHDIETRRVAGLKLTQTAIDDLAHADLRDVLLAMGLKAAPPKVGNRAPECNTVAGWDRHKARGEKPCRSCSAAHALAERKAIADRKAARLVEKPIAHGTPAGFMAHYRRGEQPCLPCVDAEHARKTQPPKSERRRPPCGTRQGYEAHCRRKEDKCGPCRAAKAVWRREQLAEERAAREKATAENRARIDEMIASLPLGTSEEDAAERGERVDALLDRVLVGGPS